MIKSTNSSTERLCSCLAQEKIKHFTHKVKTEENISLNEITEKVFLTEMLTLLSPVTTITRIPADIQDSMAFLTSFLGGSSIPIFRYMAIVGS